MKKGILGKKVGMTQIYTDTGIAVPVTVIEAGPCIVVQKKTPQVDGYHALQIGFSEKNDRNINKPLKGHFVRANVKPTRYLAELRINEIDSYELGQEIKTDIFNVGEKVDVIGTSKGKGFAGAIKRHNFHRGPMTHGSKYHRRPGAAAAKGPARIFKGRKMPGHLGAERVTVQNLEVVVIDAENNLMAVKGAVPGPKGGLLLVRDSVKAT